jgi:hypothetical protein
MEMRNDMIKREDILKILERDCSLCHYCEHLDDVACKKENLYYSCGGTCDEFALSYEGRLMMDMARAVYEARPPHSHMDTRWE